MTEYFKSLTESDYKKLKDAIALITIYIAGVDGEIDQEEIQWAEKVTKIRSYKMSEDLKGFYQEVGIDFHEVLESYINSFPRDPQARNKIIAGRLETLNPILAKLDNKVAAHLYESYKSFAVHVAKSTGGFLGFFAINPQEKKILGLDMITPIVNMDEEE
jgi:hypothetical protein